MAKKVNEGGGKMVLWAPEFPLWLDQPGFWDHACYLDYKVAPVFTVADDGLMLTETVCGAPLTVRLTNPCGL